MAWIGVPPTPTSPPKFQDPGPARPVRRPDSAGMPRVSAAFQAGLVTRGSPRIAASLGTEDVDRSGDDQGCQDQGNEGLEDHHQFGPDSNRGHISGAERKGGVERQDQVVGELRVPRSPDKLWTSPS